MLRGFQRLGFAEIPFTDIQQRDAGIKLFAANVLGTCTARILQFDETAIFLEVIPAFRIDRIMTKCLCPEINAITEGIQ